MEHRYLGIDVCSKVEHLLKEIKTTSFDSVKMRIISDAALRTDFNAYINIPRFHQTLWHYSYLPATLRSELARVASTIPAVAKSAQVEDWY